MRKIPASYFFIKVLYQIGKIFTSSPLHISHKFEYTK